MSPKLFDEARLAWEFIFKLSDLYFILFKVNLSLEESKPDDVFSILSVKQKTSFCPSLAVIVHLLPMGFIPHDQNLFISDLFDELDSKELSQQQIFLLINISTLGNNLAMLHVEVLLQDPI